MGRLKRDPLIAAMIAKLPKDGDWPVDRQLSWLNLMALAFGTVYGGDAAAHLGKSQQPHQQPTTTIQPKKPKPVYNFYIDEQGFARRADRGGEMTNASEVKGELFDLRGQDGDMKTIQWADGSTGLNGADLTIIAA